MQPEIASGNVLPFPGGLPFASLKGWVNEKRLLGVGALPLGGLRGAVPFSSEAVALIDALLAHSSAVTLADLLDKEKREIQQIVRARANKELILHMERALREFLLTAGSRALAASPAGPVAPLMPIDPAALDAWARRVGLEGLLDGSYKAIELGTQDWEVSRYLMGVRGKQSLRALLADRPGSSGPFSKAMPAAHLVKLQQRARAFLQQRASESQAALAEEQEAQAERATPLVDPHLCALEDKLEGLRIALREKLPPIARASLRDPELTLDEDKLALHFKANFHGGGRLYVGIALGGWETKGLKATCTCSAKACAHALAATDAALRFLRHGSPEHLQQLVEVVRVPTWQRALRDLDAALGGLVARRHAQEEALYSWRVGPSSRALAEVHLICHKRTKSGQWSAGSRVALRRGERPEGLAAADGEVYDVLSEAEYGYCTEERAEAGSFKALERLVGHPQVFRLGDPRAALSVRRGRLEMRVRPVLGGVAPALAIDGDPATCDAVGELLRGRRRRLAFFRDAPPECVLVEVGEEARALAQVLDRHEAIFPEEAHGELLRRLAPVEHEVPLRLPPELEGEVVEPSRQVVFQLKPDAEGLEAELWVRPLAQGAGFHPGEGPERLSAFDAQGKRVHTVRAFDEEVARARAALARLPLAASVEVRPWTYRLQGDAALDLVAALQREAGDALCAEWPQQPMRVASRPAGKADLRVAVDDKRDWFGLSGTLEVDGDRVAMAALLEAVRSGRRYVQVDKDRWVALAEELRERLARAAEMVFVGRGGLELSPAAAWVIDDLADQAAEAKLCAAWRAIVARVHASRALDPELPRGLEASLRPYQVEGYRWLCRLAEWGVGAVLADDMGLGKTVQALALLLARAKRGPALVVAPTSVCFNWAREAQRFAPALRPLLYRTADRVAMLEGLKAGDLLIASYGLLVHDADRLQKARFATVVLDEAQAIKNPATRRARAARDLQADWRMALTGTPVENHLGELWSLFRTVSPGLLGSWEQFRERYAAPIEREKDARARAALARVVRPFVLRRTKAQVAPELPRRSEILHPVTLTAAERRLYDDARLAAVAQLDGMDLAPTDVKGRFAVLAAITRLRQLACHARLLDPDSKVPSSKLAAFMDLVAELREEGHRALVFSQFTSHLALVREALDAAKVAYLYLDGQTPEAERARRVDAFQRGEAELFLISLKAGGTGLNLTAADYVIHLDPWWNPAVEDQATDRAHRIGQTRPVTVYRLVTRGTIEEAIVGLHADKRSLVAGLLGGTDAAAKLSTEDLLALIKGGGASDEAEVADEESGDEPISVEGELAAPGLDRRSAEASGGAAAGELGRLVEAFRAHLQGVCAPGTVDSYDRAVRRFVGFVQKEGREPQAGALAGLVEAYLDALARGRIEAPPSEPKVARAALGRLRAFVDDGPGLAPSR